MNVFKTKLQCSPASRPKLITTKEFVVLFYVDWSSAGIAMAKINIFLEKGINIKDVDEIIVAITLQR